MVGSILEERSLLNMKIKKCDKKKLSKWVNKNISAGSIKIIILFIPIMYCVSRHIISGFSIDEIIDTSVLMSFLVAFICESIAGMIIWAVGQKTEDSLKLTDNYSNLVKKYRRNKDKMVHYIHKDGTEVVYPVILLAQRNISESFFNISTVLGKVKKYSLPKQVADNSSRIMKAHKYSTVYNNTNIRLDDLKQESNNIVLSYSYTTYFDSLITNRAMDFEFIDGKTIREIYEPGPWLSDLSESKLSNHLGFNGFVELSDGKIIFVYRRGKVSIGKRTWAQGVGASLKAVYALDDNKELSSKGISDAIRGEIKDELKIEIPEGEDLTQSIIAFYRDILEGGKPQFLVYYKVKDLDQESFLKQFAEKTKDKSAKLEDKKKLIIDGNQFCFYTLDELRKCELEVDGIKYPGDKKLTMFPSAAASVAMLLESTKVD